MQPETDRRAVFQRRWGGNAGWSPAPLGVQFVRDFNSHGTHTASHIRRQRRVPVTAPPPLRHDDGMAPRARIAAYKVWWSKRTASTASVFRRGSVAAIDQAVTDGVDVINYSISGTTTNFLDAVEIAFLYAADAGVLWPPRPATAVPQPHTVAHPSPWVTTVAAGTHNRDGALRHPWERRDLQGRLGQRRRLARRHWFTSTAAGPAGASPAHLALLLLTRQRTPARPGEGSGQDRRLRIAASTPASNKSLAVQRGRRRRDGPRATRPPTARSTPTSTSCRRCTLDRPTGTPRSRRTRRRRARRRRINAGDDRRSTRRRRSRRRSRRVARSRRAAATCSSRT